MPAELLPVFRPLSLDDPCEVGGYRLYARLGAGGMGRVYLSYTPGGRPVALKVVRPELAEDDEFRRRFAQEVDSARRIHGLYTAEVIDSGDDWLATAYVAGPALHQVLREHGALPERTVALLLGGIAEALQVIHRAGVVHRDLKPSNVLIAHDGPRVIDFGIARAADADMLTATGVRIGSPSFMAPEQVQGLASTPATDVWALGALAAYMASGVLPFGEGPQTAVLYRVVHEEPELTGVPGSLHGLILRCLAKRPEDRPAPAELIVAAGAHPAIGGRLRFTDDWLPQQVNTEIARRAELPEAAPTAVVGAADLTTVVGAADPTRRLAVRPAAPTLRLPSDGAPPTRIEPIVPAERRRRLSRRTALLLAVLVLAAGTGGTLLYRHLADDPSADTASDVITVGSDRYVLAASADLSSPNDGYDFDLGTGKVVAQDVNAPWRLGRTSGEFYWPDTVDVFTAHQPGMTPTDCADGLDSHPSADLRFSDLGKDESFCLRSRTTRDLAIVKITAPLPEDNGKVSISLDSYQHQK